MKMYLTRFIALLLLCANYTLGLAQAKPVKTIVNSKLSQSIIPHSCGSEHANHRLGVENPEYARQLQQFKEEIIPQLSQQQDSRMSSGIIYVPVVVHVIHNGEDIGTGANLSADQIQAQIDILNQDFAGENPNFANTPAQWQGDIGNPQIQFCLASLDPNGDATEGITRSNIAVTGTDSDNNNIEDEIKPATTWNSNNYYNIWTVGIPGTTAGGGVTGYAYYPSAFTIGSNFDGSVVDYRWFGGPGFSQSGYSTLTHETGHYLGLPHTFNGLSCTVDDGIADTPEIDSSTSYYTPWLNCSSTFPTGPSSCGNEHMYVNFMDYVNDDDCSTSFTNGQINVMRSVLEGTMPSGGFNYGSRLALTNNALTSCSFYSDDAGIAAIITPGTSSCSDGEAIPVVTIQNFGTNTLTTVTTSYQINTDSPVEQSWNLSLATGEKMELTLQAFTPPAGDYAFSVTTVNPNGNADEQTVNDAIAIQVKTVVPTNLPLAEDFETTTWNPSNGGLYPYDNTGDGFMWERIENVSGFGTGVGAVVFNNFDGSGGSNPGGTTDALITSVYNFTNVTGASLTFDVAYAPFDATFYDSLKVYVSTDCGSTFTDMIYSNGNTGLATAPNSGAKFTPTASQWNTITVGLGNYDNTENLTVAFVNQSGWGNRLFLDNINISGSSSVDCSTLAGQTSKTDLTCFGSNDGTAQVQVSGGQGPYTYAWSTGETTNAIQNLGSGTYLVTVNDVNNCAIESSVEVTTPAELTTTVDQTSPSAPGVSDGSATINASGGTAPFTYQWGSGATGATQNNLSEGTYSITVTDANGCTREQSFTMSASPVTCDDFDISVNAIEIICNGGEGGLLASTVGGTSPISYEWSNGPTTNSNFNITAGVYSVTATDNEGCIIADTITLTEPPALNFDLEMTPESAPGATDGTATANVSGGVPPYTYLWSTGATTSMITNLTGGSYFVEVFDALGCGVSGQIVVETTIDCSDFVLEEIQVQDVNCFGGFDGQATAIVSGGTEPYSYIWSNNATGPSYDNFQTGTYTVTIADDNDCLLVGEIFIDQPAEGLMATYTSTPESFPGNADGGADVTPSGGTPPYTFSWGDSGTSEDLENVEAGTYEYEITDANGCMHTIFVIVPGENSQCAGFETMINVSHVTCNGDENGIIAAIGFGGTMPYSYNWDFGSTSPNLTELSGGIYILTTTDANNCVIVDTVEVTEGPPIEVSVTSTDETTIDSEDGTATVIASGGTGSLTYLWSNNETSPMIDNLVPGVYTVTVTDENDCFVVEEVEIIEFTNICFNFEAGFETSPTSCFDESDGACEVVVAGGTEPYSIEWSDGGSGFIRDGLPGGAVTVTVTDDNDCQIVLDIVIESPSALNLDVIGFGGSCGQAGTALAQLTGGTPDYDFVWNTGDTTNVIEDLEDGMYSVTVIDANGCMAEGETLIENNLSGLEIEAILDAPSCFGVSDGAIDITVLQGTEPYTFSWSNGATTEDLEDLPSDDYTVLITDAEGCSFLSTYDLTAPAELNVDIDWTPSGSGNDGTATANVFGGTTPYTYAWSNGSASPQIDNLLSGNYSVTVTDANGCTGEGSVFVGVTAIEDLVNLNEWNVVPNPSNGQFMINASFNVSEEGILEVYNVLGQRVWTQGFSAQQLIIEADLRREAAGTYFLVLRTTEGKATRKLIVKN